MSSNKKGFQGNLFEKIYCISPKTFLLKKKKEKNKGELRPQWLKYELKKFYSLTGWKLRNCVNKDRKDFSSVQSLSHVWLFVTQWTAARQASLSIANSQSLLKLMSIKPVMPSNHLVICCPLLLLPSIFPGMSLFHWVSSSHQVAKVLKLQFQPQSFQWIFRVDFLWDWLVWSPCSPGDFQEPSPAP